MKRISYAFILFFTLINCFFAQEIGNVSKEELEMKKFEKDPEADAVNLMVWGEFTITKRFKCKSKFYRKIKILTEKGKDVADIKIKYFGDEVIDDLEAVCYSPNGDEFELDSDNIFEDEVNNWKTIKFAVPGVDVGSVIEYSYTKESPYIGALSPWSFQDEYYTLKNRCKVLIARGFNFSTLERNFTSVDIELKKGTESTLDGKFATAEWTGINLPPVREEPYMTTPSDYVAHVKFQLKSFKNAYTYIDVAKTWDAVAEIMNKNLNKFINKNSGIKDTLNKILDPNLSDLQKAERIYNYVCNNIKSGDYNSIYSSDLLSPEKCLEQQKGCINERNFLLLAMLREANLKAEPIFISTRSHGRFDTAWPQLQSFNRILVWLKIKNRDYYCNCQSKYVPFGFLTSNYMVKSGFMLTEKGSKVVPLKLRSKTSKATIKTLIKINEDEDFVAETDFKYSGQLAYLNHDKLDVDDVNKVIKKYIKDLSAEVKVDSFKIVNMDSCSNDFEFKVFYKIPKNLKEAGNIKYFSSPLITKFNKNPFKAERRFTPVEFDFPYIEREKITIELPSNYRFSDIPSRNSKRYKGLSYRKSYKLKDNRLEISRSFRIKSVYFHNKQYLPLKNFFAEMINADNDEISIITN